MSIIEKCNFVKKILLNQKYKSFLKESWALTWPIMLIMLFDFFMNTTDVYIASKIGKNNQAAIGMANQTYFFFTAIVAAITVGTIAVVSRIFSGVDKDKKLPSAVLTAIAFTTICAIIITIIAVTVAPIAMEHLKVKQEVKDKVIPYFRIYGVGILFHLIIINFNGIFRACKMIKYSMVILVSASLLNIILTIVLVFHTPLYDYGIPLATAICWIAAFIAMVPFILKLTKGEKKLSSEIAEKIFRISWPSGIIMLSWQLSNLILYNIVGLLPENSVETMAAMTAGLRIESMIFMPAFAFNMANAVLVGNLLGEERREDAFEMGLVTATMGVSLIIVITAIVISCASPIANFLAAKDEFGRVDPLVLTETIKYLHIVMLSEPFMAANLMFGGALNGAGDTRALMRYALFSLWVIRIPIAYIFAITLGIGAIAIWWAMNLTFLSQSILSGRRYFSKKWIT